MLLRESLQGPTRLENSSTELSVILGLGQEITDAIIDAENEEDHATVSDTEGQIYDENNEPILKAGVKLPKSAQQWKAAEDHFRGSLASREIPPNCLSENIEEMNRSLYDYFAGKYGKENDKCPSELAERYKDKTKNDLKRILKTLKNSPPENVDSAEIKYVAKLLRQKIKDNAENKIPFSTSEDHNILVQKNVWNYAKKFITKRLEISPTFPKIDCI